MTPGRPRSPNAGFTLVEMLIALTIFAMLTAAGVTLLSVTARTQQTADRLLDEYGDLRALQALVGADLALAVPRIHRSSDGARLPAFSASPAARPFLLNFVRNGIGSDAADRSDLQRVEYRLRGDRLERWSYPHVDGSQSLAAMTLLRDVRQLRLRYRDGEGGWHDAWAPTDPTDLPKAVEIVTDSHPHGLVRQLFIVGAAL